jgi:hypothetical protein
MTSMFEETNCGVWYRPDDETSRQMKNCPGNKDVRGRVAWMCMDCEFYKKSELVVTGGSKNG